LIIDNKERRNEKMKNGKNIKNKKKPKIKPSLFPQKK